jgi:hypothetical protein
VSLAPPYGLGGYKTNQSTHTAQADLSSANTKLKTPLDVEGGVFDVGNNTAELSSAVQGTPDNSKKMTKRELLELADYLYGRYQYSKKPLNKGSSQTILEIETNHTKTSKGGSP